MKPLREGESPLAELLRSAAPLETTPDAATHARVREAFLASRRPRRLVLLSAVGVAAAVVCLVLGLQWSRSTRALEPRSETGDLGWTWVALDDSSRREGDTLHLGPGALAVDTRRPFELTTPAASVVSNRARFNVMVSRSGTTVTVEEGFVVVRARGVPDRRVAAGEHWESVNDASADATFHKWALELERLGRVNDALVVLDGLSQTDSVWAELALYDAARIETDRHNTARARALLTRYWRRYPEGVLERELKALEQRLGE